jgi:hypothetical protein
VGLDRDLEVGDRRDGEGMGTLPKTHLTTLEVNHTYNHQPRTTKKSQHRMMKLDKSKDNNRIGIGGKKRNSS